MSIITDINKIRMPERKHCNIGDYFPNILISETENIRLHDLIKDYLIVAAVSTTCSPCLPAMEALEIFIQEQPHINLIILIVTDDDTYQLAKQAYPIGTLIYQVPDHVLMNELNIHGYPWSYGINSEGQIITHEQCGELRRINAVIQPFTMFHTEQPVL